MLLRLAPLAVIATASLVSAQQFRPGLTHDVLDQSPSFTPGFPLAADLDGDGRVDLAFGRGLLQAPNFVYRNRGVSFTPIADPGISQLGLAVMAFDADGDGDLDLLDSDGPSRLLRNDGDMQFVDVSSQQLPLVQNFGGEVAADIDSDGDLDLLTPWGQVLTNDGAGTFTDETAARVTTSGFAIGDRMAVADFDGDGDLDFVIMSGLHRNDGSGNFALDAAAGGSHSYGNAPFATDIDNDGDVDLMLASGNLLTNDGTGTLTDTGPVLQPPHPTSLGLLAVGDLDGDGFDDLVVSTNFGASNIYAPTWLRNDGSGGFSPNGVTPLTEHGMAIAHVALADLDGDQDLDLVHTNVQTQGARPAVVSYNDGAGNFFTATSLGGLQTPRSFERFACDVDGDGDEDLLVESVLFENDGRGGLTRRLLGSNVHARAAADVDGDGDLDLIGSRQVFRNHGGLQFSASSQLTPSNEILRTVAVLDLNDDQAPDLVGQLYGNTWSAWINDGTGTFTQVAPATFGIQVGQTPNGFGVADLDQDGDDDLLLSMPSNWMYGGFPVLQFRNDGNGAFSPVPMPASPWAAAGVRVADFEGDGDLDFVTNTSFIPLLYVNDGSGQFTVQELNGIYGIDLIPDDVDGDGDADLWLRDGTWFSIAINDGSNAFTVDPTRISDERPNNSVADIALLDLDSDGDNDAMLAPQLTGGVHQWHFQLWNHRRQLRAPHLTRTGGVLELLLTTHGQTGVTFAMLAISTAPANVQVPGIGRLGLEPLEGVVLPVPMIGGEALVQYGIPSQPSLAGLPLYAQALVDLSGTPKLTGAVRNVIVP